MYFISLNSVIEILFYYFFLETFRTDCLKPKTIKQNANQEIHSFNSNIWILITTIFCLNKIMIRVSFLICTICLN